MPATLEKEKIHDADLDGRILLEDIGRRVSKRGKTEHWIIENLAEKVGFPKPLPKTVHIIIEPHGQELDCLPMMAGTQAWHFNRKSMRNMLTAMEDDILGMVDKGQTIRIINVPNGGSAMECIDPIADMIWKTGRPPISVPISSNMKLSRYYDGLVGDYRWKLLGYADNGENKIHGDVYIIKDFAAASGTTSLGAATLACEGGKTEGGIKIEGSLPKAKKIMLFLGIGSMESLVKIYEYCLEKGIELIPIFSNAIFQVSNDNNVLSSLKGMTDLPFFNKGTITTASINRMARRVYGSAKICVAGDTGRRFMEIYHYYLERLVEITKIQKSDTPLPINEPEWELARLMLESPIISPKIPEIQAYVENSIPLSKYDEDVIIQEIKSILKRI